MHGEAKTCEINKVEAVKEKLAKDGAVGMHLATPLVFHIDNEVRCDVTERFHEATNQQRKGN